MTIKDIFANIDLSTIEIKTSPNYNATDIEEVIEKNQDINEWLKNH